MKTVKYEMYLNTHNLYGPTVPITKKQYDAFLQGYNKAIAENHKKEQPKNYDKCTDCYEENENYAKDFKIETTEYEKYTETKHLLFDFGFEGGCLVLIKLKTKDGYHWK